MDAVNVDLKAFTEDFYWKLCTSHLGAVLDTLIYLKRETDVWVEITTLLIPGENDSPGEVEELSQWVMENLGPDVPLHFSAFHPDWKMRDKPEYAARDPDPRLAHRPRRGPALRLHRQHPQPSHPEHRLPRLRRGADRPRLVPAQGLGPRRCGRLPRLRHALCRRLRRPARHLGPPSPAPAAERACGGDGG